MNTEHQDSETQSQDQQVRMNACIGEGDWSTATFGGRDDIVEASPPLDELDSYMRGTNINKEGRSKELQFEAVLQERILIDEEEAKEGSTQVSAIEAS